MPILTFVLLLIGIEATWSEEKARRNVLFDIPQQRADLALTEFAEQADLTLIFPDDLVRGESANELRGEYSIQQGIELLLKGTGLIPEFSNDYELNISVDQAEGSEGETVKRNKTSTLLAALAAIFTLGANAQEGAGTDADANDEFQEGALEEVVVLGIRQALNDAMDYKRGAAQVLDTVPIGDLGELPTISIADTLEFMPGVTGKRFRGNVDEIALRGLPQLLTMSTVNGRELTSGDGGRYVRYRIWPSNFFDRATILKSPLPDQVEGGIAGTIELQTPSALGYDDPSFDLDVRGQYSDFNDNNDLIDDTGMRANGKFAYSFDTANGEAGLLVALDYMDNPLVIGQALLPSYSKRTLFGQQTIVPNVAIFQNDTESFERVGGLGVFEWSSNNGTALRVDTIFTSSENPQKRTMLQINNLNAPNRYVGADIQGGALQSGSLKNLLVLSRFEDLEREDDAYMIGANLSKAFGDWQAEFDVYASKTEVDFQLYRPLFRAVGVGTDFEFNGSDLLFTNFSKDLTEQQNWGAHQYFAFDRQIEDRAEGISFDLDRDLDGFFTGVKFGARYSERSMDRIEVRSIDNSVRNGNLYPELAIGALDPSLFAEPYIEFDLRNMTAGAFPTPFAVFDRKAAFNALPQPDFTVDNDDLLNRYVDNVEQSLAVYLRGDFATSLAGNPLTGALGVRIVNTELTASGFTGTPVAVTDPDTGSVIIEVPGDLTPARETNDYTEVLPSLNMSYEFSENWVTRLGIARALSRPDFLDLRMAQSLNGGDIDDQPFTGSAGNPSLDPIISDQIDISVEWYPREGTALTSAIYYKDVSGFVVTDVRSANIGGYDYELSSPINAEDGEFYGIEFSLRHDLDYLPGPFDGLGIWATASFNETTVEPEYGVLKDIDEATGDYLYDVKDRNPGVEGFAERTASGVIFYQKNRLSLRASARYVSDRIRNVASLNAPIVSDSRTIFDFAGSFKFNNKFRLHFQALNLTEESNDGYFAFNNYIAVNQQVGRTYYLGFTLSL